MPSRVITSDAENIDLLSDHAHSAQKVYPTLVNGTTITGGAGAWALGSFVQVVPVNTVTLPFDIHFVNVGDVSATDTYELVLYSGLGGSEVEIGRCRFSRTSAANTVSPTPMQTPIQPANTRISAKIASSSGGADTAVISLFYHHY
jgi:hypothetical protein